MGKGGSIYGGGDAGAATFRVSTGRLVDPGDGWGRSAPGGAAADRPILAEAWSADAAMSSTRVGEDAYRGDRGRGRTTRLVVGLLLAVTVYGASAIK
jgi:hypothetical protein